MGLRCASDSFNLQVTSQMTFEGEHIAGSWAETTTGASGPSSGSIGPNRMDAVVGGAGISARLSLALRGDMQAITLTTQGNMNTDRVFELATVLIGPTPIAFRKATRTIAHDHLLAFRSVD